MVWARFLLAASLVFFVAFPPIGCGPRVIKVEQPKLTPVDSIKAYLEAIAGTGRMGSEVDLLEEGIQKLKGTDAAKGDALLKDLQQLKSLTDPARVTAKAKEMLGKL
jgi:hypothetical protein